MEFVNVPVPVSRLKEVYGLLAEDPVPVIKSRNEWSDALIKKAFEESSDRQQDFLVHLAKRPDQVVPAAELREATEQAPYQLRGMMGAFATRALRYKKTKWFFDYDYDGQQLVFSMDFRTAKAIMEVVKATFVAP